MASTAVEPGMGDETTDDMFDGGTEWPGLLM